MKIFCSHIISGIVLITATIVAFYYKNDINFDLLLQQDTDGTPLFTNDHLSEFKGLNEANGKKIYLALLGKVYDVTKGAKHYGPNSGYHFFTGRDASRAFITGDFKSEEATDAVIDLSLSDFKSLNNWRQFYDSEYVNVGKLIGRYYDERGDPTTYNKAVEDRFKDAEESELNKITLQRKYPPCNVEWDSERGTRVWCSKKSGGFHRNWTGVPRKLFEPGAKSHRCACVSHELLGQKNIEEYDNCPSDAISCYVVI